MVSASVVAGSSKFQGHACADMCSGKVHSRLGSLRPSVTYVRHGLVTYV